MNAKKTYSRNDAKTRTLTLGGKSNRGPLRGETYYYLLTLLAAAALEKSAVYIKENADGTNVKCKVYAGEETVDFYVDLRDGVKAQIEEAVTKIWGEDTLNDVKTQLALDASIALQDVAHTSKPASGTGKGVDGA